MKTVAIIQARMGSTRLPGKVLRPLAGRPVLWHVVHRLRKCRTVDEIVIATSALPVDDPIEDFGAEQGVRVTRGPEDNVLQRYMLAARRADADIVVRVTGDAPLVDPATLDAMVEALEESGAGYCAARFDVPTIHEGFEPFTRQALEKLSVCAGADPVAREHITAYFKQHPDFVPIHQLDVEPTHQLDGVRLSVDTPSDLDFLEALYEALSADPGEVRLDHVVRLLRTRPELTQLNSRVLQKSATARTRRILFRCDGDGTTGLGHLYRCLALAAEFRDHWGWGVTFAVSTGEVAMARLQAQHFPVEGKPKTDDEGTWLHALAKRIRPDVLFVDVCTGLERGVLARIRSEGVRVAVIDDFTDRRLSADVAFYPPVPQTQDLDWEGFRGRAFVGWEWVPLRRQFTERCPSPSRRVPTILVTMGGADPARLTPRVIRALDVMTEPFKVVVVVGSACPWGDEIGAVIRDAKHAYELRQDVSDMGALMADADMAVSTFGVVAYELAAMAVPSIHLSLSEDHARSADAFQSAGIALSLGPHDRVSDEVIRHALLPLLKDPGRRLQMRARARAAMDGRGAQRIAEAIGSCVEAMGGEHECSEAMMHEPTSEQAGRPACCKGR